MVVDAAMRGLRGGRHTVEIPRPCVLAGKANPNTYLRDETGNRCFWPLRCGSIDIGALARDRARSARVDLARTPDPEAWLTNRLGPLASFEIRRCEDVAACAPGPSDTGPVSTPWHPA